MNSKKIYLKYTLPFLLAGGLLTGCGSDSYIDRAAVKSAAYQEVVEDIAGNANGKAATAAQINSIEGVSGAREGVDYSAALASGKYVDPKNPTAAEITAVINAKNAADKAAALKKIADYAADNTNPKPTVKDYEDAGVTGVTPKNVDAVNNAVDAVTGPDADTTPKIQKIVDDAAAAAKAAALKKIADYADDNTNPAPTVQDYADAGVTGVTADNLAKANAAVDAVTREEADTTPEVQALINSVVPDAKTAALAKIAAYADDKTNPAPTVADYAAAGVTGVTDANLAKANAAVDAVTGPDADTTPEVQALVDAALKSTTPPTEDAKTAALKKIAAYADDKTNPAPTVADYAAAGVTGVTDANLAKANAAVDAVTGPDADTTPEVQALVDAALKSTTPPTEDAKTAALKKIAAYADDKTNPAPTVADYAAAGVTGVADANLAEANAAVDAVTGTEADTTPEVQALIDAAAKAKRDALAKIAAYADDKTNPEPTVADYAAAGVTGVTDANLATANAAVDAVTGTEADTTPEVQALVDAAAKEAAALKKITDYAADKTNPAPSVDDYKNAGVTGVTDANLDEVNKKVDATDAAGADTTAEVQALADAGSKTAAALKKIADYADDNTNPKPTVSDYTDAGVTGVTAANLDKVNAEIDAVIGVQADTTPEVQAIVDNIPAPLPTGMTITDDALKRNIVSLLDAAYSIDIPGIIDMGATPNGLVVKVPYTTTGGVTLPAHTSTFTIASSSTQDGESGIVATFAWPEATLPAGSGTFDAYITIDDTSGNGDGIYNTKQLSIAEAGTGLTVATFKYATDDAGNTGALTLNALPGVVDKMFGKEDNAHRDNTHSFLYLPVTNQTTGKTWLNNNLGANYANLEHAAFDMTAQATAVGDQDAIGSQYQWGRKSDGHELSYAVNSGSLGHTPLAGSYTRQDDPTTVGFINTSNDWRVNSDTTLWESESSPNNPCPVGYRIPTLAEIEEERTTWSVNNLHTSELKLSNRIWTSLGQDPRPGYETFIHNAAQLYSDARILPSQKAVGMSVRCIQD